MTERERYLVVQLRRFVATDDGALAVLNQLGHWSVLVAESWDEEDET